MSASRNLAGDLDWLVGRIREGYEPEKIAHSASWRAEMTMSGAT